MVLVGGASAAEKRTQGCRRSGIWRHRRHAAVFFGPEGRVYTIHNSNCFELLFEL
jgi:hypothetical protein